MAAMQPRAASGMSALDAATPSQQPDVPSIVREPAVPRLLDDAGADGDGDEEMALADAGTSPTEPMRDAGADAWVAPAEPMPTDPACSRERLRELADEYLAALGRGDASALVLHARARYTENGQEQMMGVGLWLNGPRLEFARHALDPATCGSATQAVLTTPAGIVLLGLRLGYLDAQLLDIEAHVAPPNQRYFAPEEIIPRGSDPWAQPVPEAERSSAAELSQVAMDYFNSVADPNRLPPSAQDCERRQNGALMSEQGSCRIAPGSERFEQTRYAVLDTSAGIVVVMTKYTDYIGMYLFKVHDGTILDIEVVGGATSAATGW